MTALQRIEEAIGRYSGTIEMSVHHYLPEAARHLELERQLRIMSRTESALLDLLDAHDRLFDGEQIEAAELHGPAVLKALGLTPKERRAVTMFYALGRSRRRSMAEIATELKMSERRVSTFIQAIREKVPELRYPFIG